MADGKNSIIVYRDWKKIFDELSDEEAGKFFDMDSKLLNFSQWNNRKLAVTS